MIEIVLDVPKEFKVAICDGVPEVTDEKGIVYRLANNRRELLRFLLNAESGDAIRAPGRQRMSENAEWEKRMYNFIPKDAKF